MNQNLPMFFGTKFSAVCKERTILVCRKINFTRSAKKPHLKQFGNRPLAIILLRTSSQALTYTEKIYVMIVIVRKNVEIMPPM